MITDIATTNQGRNKSVKWLNSEPVVLLTEKLSTDLLNFD